MAAAPDAPEPGSREATVATIVASIRRDPWPYPPTDHPQPGRLASIVERLRTALFPQTAESVPHGDDDIARHIASRLREAAAELERELGAAFACAAGPGERTDGGAGRTAAQRFLAELPSIREMLVLDAQSAFDGDPAARSVDEVILCYPGFRALLVHRLAHALHRLGVPLVPRMMAERAHAETGIDIHPGATIGRGFFIDHGTGVVIGETTSIGEFCKIYQGVTLGAKSFERDETGRIRKGYKRHPTLEDHVTVYAGATILGGNTVIGRGSVVAGGVFVMQSVPANHVVAAPRLELRVREQRMGL